MRKEADLEVLKSLTLKLADTKFYITSKRIIEFDNHVANTGFIINSDTSSINQSDTIYLSSTCLPEGVIFKSQFQLDSFRVLYPNCTEIQGAVKIIYNIENPITHFYGLQNVKKMGGLYLNYGIYKSLNGLENLEEIAGALSIHNADSLSNLHGLSSLNKIGSFLANDLNINNLEGLESLQTVERNFQIYDNDELVSLEGISNLQQIGYDKQPQALNNLLIGRNQKLESIASLENLSGHHFKGNIRITSNPLLESLNGLQIINLADGLVEIHNNESLLDLNGLENLTQVERLKISGNENLISITGLESLETVEYGLEIHNNAALYDLEGIKNLKNVGFRSKQDALPYLKISANENLISLSPLRNIEFPNNFFNGILTLRDNPSILNFLGLERLTGAYVLEVTNLGIPDFKDLNQLKRVPNLLSIKNNYSLLSLGRLENLTDLGDETERGFKTLEIEGNSRLKSLAALKNLRSEGCLLYTSPSPRDATLSRMPSSA